MGQGHADRDQALSQKDDADRQGQGCHLFQGFSSSLAEVLKHPASGDHEQC